MRIPEQIVDQIYENLDILEVVQDYRPNLKKKGANWWGLSPFQKEKTPSFAVNPSKGIYKCFSSGKGGNAVSFIMEYQGVDYRDALEILAERQGIEIPVGKVKEIKDRTLIVNRMLAQMYHENLLSNQEALSYIMDGRDLSYEMIVEYNVGMCNGDEWKSFTKDDQEWLISMGHYDEGEFGMWMPLKNRIIFPVRNILGHTIGFSGRAWKEGHGGGKYINSPNRHPFDKGGAVYGLFSAKKQIRKQRYALLVEGQTDVLGLRTAGVEGVIGIQGTGFTDRHAQLISSTSENVKIFLDGGDAGQKASLRVLDECLKANLHCEIVPIGLDQDPDDVRKTEDAKEVIKKSIYWPDRYLAMWRGVQAELKSPTIDRMCISIACIPDEIKRLGIIEYVAENMGVSTQSILRRCLKHIDPPKKLIKAKGKAKDNEYQLCAILATAGDNLEKVLEWIDIEGFHFKDPQIDMLRMSILGQHDLRKDEGALGPIYSEMMIQYSWNPVAAKKTALLFRKNFLDKKLKECADILAIDSENASVLKLRTELIKLKTNTEIELSK